MQQSLIHQPAGLDGLPPNLPAWLLQGGFLVAVAGGGYLVLKKVIQNIQHNKLLHEVGTNTADGYAIGYATRCYAAIIPTGHPWVNDTVGDGTELEDLYQVAREIRTSGVGFALVATKYKVLYDRDLLSDISNDLSREEVGKFNSIITTGLGGVQPFAPLLTHSLTTTRWTKSYDEHLVPLLQVPPNTRLGVHTQSMQTAGLGTLHGFAFEQDGQILTRFAPADAVQLRRLGA